MTEDKTLYVSDLDGTLLNQNASLSEYTINLLNKLISSGINFTVATGRTTDATKKIMADIDLNIPIISFNGAIIYSIKQKNYIKVYWLANETVKNIINVLKSHKVSSLMYELKDNVFIGYYEALEQKYMNDFVEDRKKRFNTNFCQVNEFNDISLEHIMYFALGDTYDRIKSVYEALNNIPNITMSMVNNTYSNDLWFLEVYSAEASKQNAVKFLRDTYGFKKIIGFGDNHNDLPMFKACDVCVAVTNAIDEVKAAADFICNSNQENGVAKWIENHI
jgi:5-amino-6-(5-phospho-D-ribitylamino)uracil phosphatase